MRKRVGFLSFVAVALSATAASAATSCSSDHILCINAPTTSTYGSTRTTSPEYQSNSSTNGQAGYQAGSESAATAGDITSAGTGQ